jgi:Conserved oligomeric complex COG6
MGRNSTRCRTISQLCGRVATTRRNRSVSRTTRASPFWNVLESYRTRGSFRFFFPAFLVPHLSSLVSSFPHCKRTTTHRNTIESQRTVLALFLARFTLTEDEANAIASRDVPIGRAFFNAMDRTERIRQECRVLMVGGDGEEGTNMRAGYAPLLTFLFFSSFIQISKC